MKTDRLNIIISMVLLLGCFTDIYAQSDTSAQSYTKEQSKYQNKSHNSLTYKGLFSAYTHYNPTNQFQWWNGARYIPHINFETTIERNSETNHTQSKLLPNRRLLLDFEASANIYGNLGLEDFQQISTDGKIKPYRAWARISGTQFEVRAGLQKINFGSAKMLRPLMWFDQMDPRDPIQLTDGVWGVLGRYYFLNNSNIWLWALHGNKELKGWENIKTHNSTPEIGGRIQHPAGRGEIAISYHYRKIDGTIIAKIDGAIEISDLQNTTDIPEKIPEHRFGIDAKFDWIIGLWMEGSWTTIRENIGTGTNQHLLNVGADYTFGIGNGLTVTYEHLLASFDRKAFKFRETTSFSALSASYPLSLLDQLTTICYFDWDNRSPYFFINWQRQFNKLTFNLIGYSNPKEYRMPSQNQAMNLFAGNGIQLMLIYNH